jgi:uncharacterized protein (DUF1015 family)
MSPLSLALEFTDTLNLNVFIKQIKQEPVLAEICPFHGIHYNPSLVKDLTSVICPPYDVISPEQQLELYQRSDNNFVRIEFGREMPQDGDNDNKYTRAAKILGNWLENGILVKDRRPAIYLHEHRFTYDNRGYYRRGIICRVKLEEWDKMVVRPHESTFSRARSDRLSMLWIIQANTSPIMALYEDSGKGIAEILDVESKRQPLIETSYEDGESYRLWVIEDHPVIKHLSQCFQLQPIYIADGHHRYESALTYRRERHFGNPTEYGKEPYDFVMMSLVEFDDPGLLILPAHRLIRGVTKSNLASLISSLDSVFNVRKIPTENRTPDDVFRLITEQNDQSSSLILYGLLPGYYLQLETRKDITINQVLPHLHTDYNQKFSVSIVDHLILEGIMGFTPETLGSLLSYTSDAREAINLVSSQEYQLAFLVNPVRSSDIKSVADSGGRMPKKSTYFYPKLPAGLVFYRFV